MDSIQDLVQLAHQAIHPNGDTVSAFAEDYMRQLTDALGRLPEASTRMGKKQKEYIKVLKEYICSYYRPPFEDKTPQVVAIALNLPINEKSFREYYQAFKHILTFVLDTFEYKPIEYAFESFKDTSFERLFCNDGREDLVHYPQKTYVNSFIRFFIDGDADDSKDYSSKSYYGSLPVSEAKVREYCKQKQIPDDYVNKLIGIMKASRRFKSKETDGEIRYALQVQYLINIYAMSVSILYEEGKPLHREELCRRINKLHKQYPSLVDSTSQESFVLRRKPILSASGKKGNWCLRIWENLEEGASRGDTAQAYEIIRSYVTVKHEETGQPVSLDSIEDHMKECGYNYPKRSLQTYVTNSGCKSVRNGNYLPPDADEEGTDTRYWTGKTLSGVFGSSLCLLFYLTK